MTAGLTCCDEHRRQLIREQSLNGLDYIDVHGSHLCVHFLTGIPLEFLPATDGPQKGKPLTPDEKKAALRHIFIRGGRRITGINAIDFDTKPAATRFDESCLGITVNKEGDWSEYTICFVEVDEKSGEPTDEPLKSLDRRYACAGFTFKADCPAEIDCKSEAPCPTEVRPKPPISYLARDYTSFRQLILDRLSLVMPDWRERHVPDVGIAIVEVLAYTADYLSYYLDAVGTEQYLDTARQRTSVRRHVRLIDYAMHDGCNARVFLELRVTGDPELDPRNIYFITRPAGSSAPAALRASDLEKLPPGWLAFEPLTDKTTIKLHEVHNLIHIYTWGDKECCIPRGATRTTLLDEPQENNKYDPDLCGGPPPHKHYDGCGCPPPPPPPEPPHANILRLEPGDFLLFEEPGGDRTHRHVVRLTKVTPCCDPLLGNRVLEVEWSREDALPFALCVSAVGAAPDCEFQKDLGVARGNIVLADHGATISDEPLAPILELPFADHCEGEGTPAERARVTGRYRPVLTRGPLTFAEPLAASASASAVMQQNARAARPAITAGSIPPALFAGDPADDDDAPSLFRPDELRDIHALASSLLKPEPEQRLLLALRRRLRPEVVKLLDAGKDTPDLEALLEANLRGLMEIWSPRADLLDSGDDPHFVAEVDDAGLAHLRFGDGDTGRAVEAGMSFVATYRTGNGREGLVGPEAIAHVVFRSGFNDGVTLVRNPLPSAGAVDPESVAEVKAIAPAAVRKDLQRAVTAGDYATLAQYLRFPARNPRVQAAAGNLYWNRSWYEADVAVDEFGTSDLDADLQTSVAGLLHRYRRMGHDLRVGRADSVPLRIELELLVQAHHLRAHVVAAVRDALSNRALPDGRLGFFHPDNLSFGEAVYVSRIVAAVMAVDGVAKVCVARLERLADESRGNPDFADGLLKLGPNEIARLDNDPAVPENGLLVFAAVGGGR